MCCELDKAPKVQGMKATPGYFTFLFSVELKRKGM